jgi:UDP-N-acetylmuramoyl-tripeptide--D-alanyl-D-alanine ligase
LTLARMPTDTERAIFEIGMSTPGEIAPRSGLVQPHLAMITRIAPAHLQGMGSVEGVADEKSQIFAGLVPGGSVILPARDYFFERLKRRALELQPTAEVFTYGGEPDRQGASALSYETDGMTSRIIIDVMGEVVSVQLHAVGDHWGANAALALIAAAITGIRPREAAEALTGYAPPAGRGVAHTLSLPFSGDVVLVDDAYNANPESMRAAIEGLARRPGRRIVALGEMRELGEGSAALHAGLAGALIAADVSEAVLSGHEMASLVCELEARKAPMRVRHVKGPEEALEFIKTLLEPGDVLLIKGSNASGMGRIGVALRQMSLNAKGSKAAPGA